MADPIQNIPLGLLAGLPPGITPSSYVHGMPAPIAPGATPRRAPPRTETPTRGQGLLPGLFNQQPSGYTPDDVRKVMEDQASYYQRFPITPQWNGGRGAGGILPGIANFGSGFMGSYMQGQQQATARENERVRSEAARGAGGAATLEEAVAALQGGTPDQSNVAMQLHLQNLAKDKERQRQTAIMQQIYGASPGAAASPAATAPPPSAAQLQVQPQPQSGSPTAPPAAPASAEGNFFTIPPLAPQVPQTEPSQYQSMTGGSIPPRQPALLNAGAAAPGVQPNPSATAAAPPVPTAPENTAPVQPQSEATVQIGQFRLPLSEARRRAALGRAQGIDVKPLEDAIDVAETAEKKAAEARGTAQANMPQAMQAANSLVRNIDWLLDNQSQVAGVTGWQGQGWWDAPAWYNPLAYVPEGTSRADTKERIRQVTGQGFVQAFNSIKGAGPISDQEGAAASAAITRLENRGQSDEQYMQAVRDARREIWELMNVARAKAGQPPIPYQPHASEARQGQGGVRPQQAGPTSPGNYVWTPDGGLQRR